MARPRENPEVRFWRYVSPEPNSGCWLWMGGLVEGGYGQFCERPSDGNGYAHRFAWSAFRGPIPRGKWVLHECDTPACVNPDHLYIGDHAANEADKAARNRHARGDRHGSRTKPHRILRGSEHPMVKLDATAVASIRASDEPHKTIARRYGVSGTQIRRIRRRQSWGHI